MKGKPIYPVLFKTPTYSWLKTRPSKCKNIVGDVLKYHGTETELTLKAKVRNWAGHVYKDPSKRNVTIFFFTETDANWRNWPETELICVNIPLINSLSGSLVDQDGQIENSDEEDGKIIEKDKVEDGQAGDWAGAIEDISGENIISDKIKNIEKDTKSYKCIAVPGKEDESNVLIKVSQRQYSRYHKNTSWWCWQGRSDSRNIPGVILQVDADGEM